MLPLVGASNIASIRDAQSLDVTYTVRCLLELLYVRHGYSSLSVMLYYCACYYVMSTGLLCVAFMYLVYDFNNKSEGSRSWG